METRDVTVLLAFSSEYPELHHLMFPAVKAAADPHIPDQFLISPSYQSALSLLTPSSSLLGSCFNYCTQTCVAPPAVIRVVYVTHEDQIWKKKRMIPLA